MGYIQASSSESLPSLENQEQQQPEEEDTLPDWSSMAGRGDAEYPGFPSDGSQPLPDLSNHHNVLATVLLQDPDLYEKLKDLRTGHGSSLAQCVKPGIDNKGHKIVRTLGLMAADESCYTIFQPLFRTVMNRWHDIILQDVANSTPPKNQVKMNPDPEGQVVLSVQEFECLLRPVERTKPTQSGC